MPPDEVQAPPGITPQDLANQIAYLLAEGEIEPEGGGKTVRIGTILGPSDDPSAELEIRLSNKQRLFVSIGGPDRILQPPPLKLDARHKNPFRDIIPRERIERRVVWNLLRHLADAGWHPEKVDSDEAKRTTTPLEVMEEVFNLDEATVYFTRRDGRKAHWVKIVLGNDGIDCISDWTYSGGDDDGFHAAMDAFEPERYA